LNGGLYSARDSNMTNITRPRVTNLINLENRYTQNENNLRGTVNTYRPLPENDGSSSRERESMLQSDV
jgi:hypothetical protein